MLQERCGFNLAAMDAVRIGCSRNRIVVSWHRWMLEEPDDYKLAAMKCGKRVPLSLQLGRDFSLPIGGWLEDYDHGGSNFSEGEVP